MQDAMADDKKTKKDDKPKDEKPKDAKDAKGAKPSEEKDGAEEGAVAAEPESSSKFSRKKILLFVALPLFLIIALGAGAYFMGFFTEAKPLNCENVKEGDKNFAACSEIQDASAAAKPVSFLNVPDLIVNLNSPAKQPRFLKVSLKIELESEADEKKMEALLPRVVDQFQMYLRELRIEDLRGTSGIYRLKIELLSRVRASAPNVKVRDVLFQEILVQ
jgi:flagellar FliL protein